MYKLYTRLKRRDPLTASTYNRQREFQAAVAINACKHTKLLVWYGGWKQIPLLVDCITLLNKCTSNRRCVQMHCTVCDGPCKQCYKQRVVHIDELLLDLLLIPKYNFCKNLTISTYAINSLFLNIKTNKNMYYEYIYIYIMSLFFATRMDRKYLNKLLRHVKISLKS